GVPGFHEPDARRVSVAGPALRGGVPRPDGGMAHGWEAADRAPVYCLPKLSPADTGRSALVYPGLPEDLYPPGGLMKSSDMETRFALGKGVIFVPVHVLS